MTNESIQGSNNTEGKTGEENLDNSKKDNAVDNRQLIKEFNEILGSHIERLLDTRLGIEELELNIFSVSCIVLLATRETEIETFPARPPSRYTESTIIEELSEMSIEPDSEVKKVLADMTGKSYLKLTDERIFCNKPMSSMAQLFDRIFPNMPGLNLVAYLGQMLDEVTAGRKTQEEAFKQFNQMLEIQGVSINESATSKSSKKKFSYLRLGEEKPAEKKMRKPVIVSAKPVDIFSQLKTSNVIKTAPPVKENKPSPVKEKDIENSENLFTDEINAGANPDDKSETAEYSNNITDNLKTEEIKSEETSHDINGQQNRISDSFEPPDDKEIEDKILEFEEQLGLKCPLCGTGGIKTSETAKGKSYYHCSNSDCNFISWGKPYYFECPKCDSNFLIEIVDSNGKNFLKCPKATCTHWQKFPWDESNQTPEYSNSDTDAGGVINKPKRKVRRKRRVVRRKRPA